MSKQVKPWPRPGPKSKTKVFGVVHTSKRSEIGRDPLAPDSPPPPPPKRLSNRKSNSKAGANSSISSTNPVPQLPLPEIIYLDEADVEYDGVGVADDDEWNQWNPIITNVCSIATVKTEEEDAAEENETGQEQKLLGIELEPEFPQPDDDFCPIVLNVVGGDDAIAMHAMQASPIGQSQSPEVPPPPPEIPAPTPPPPPRSPTPEPQPPTIGLCDGCGTFFTGEEVGECLDDHICSGAILCQECGDELEGRAVFLSHICDEAKFIPPPRPTPPPFLAPPLPPLNLSLDSPEFPILEKEGEDGEQVQDEGHGLGQGHGHGQGDDEGKEKEVVEKCLATATPEKEKIENIEAEIGSGSGSAKRKRRRRRRVIAKDSASEGEGPDSDPDWDVTCGEKASQASSISSSPIALNSRPKRARTSTKSCQLLLKSDEEEEVEQKSEETPLSPKLLSPKKPKLLEPNAKAKRAKRARSSTIPTKTETELVEIPESASAQVLPLPPIIPLKPELVKKIKSSEEPNCKPTLKSKGKRARASTSTQSPKVEPETAEIVKKVAVVETSEAEANKDKDDNNSNSSQGMEPKPKRARICPKNLQEFELGRRNSINIGNEQESQSADGSFPCEQEACVKSFGSIRALKIHQSRAHQTQTEAQSSPTPAPIAKQEFDSKLEGCDKSFTSQNSLYMHLVLQQSETQQQSEAHEPGDQAEEAGEGSRNNGEQEQANISSPIVEQQWEFVCTIGNCGKSFVAKKSLNMHINWHRRKSAGGQLGQGQGHGHGHGQSQAGDVPCPIPMPAPIAKKEFDCKLEGCDKSFISQNSLYMHLVWHQNQEEVQAKARETVRDQDLATNSVESFSSCELEGCGKSFASFRALKIHVTKVHQTATPGACAPATVVEPESASVAMETEPESENKPKVFDCELEGCAKSFGSSRALKIHIGKSHTTASIPIVGQQSETQQQSEAHGAGEQAGEAGEGSGTNGEQEQANVSSPIVEQQWEFVCTIGNCGKSFVGKKSLTMHINWHGRKSAGGQLGQGQGHGQGQGQAGDVPAPSPQPREQEAPLDLSV